MQEKKDRQKKDMESWGSMRWLGAGIEFCGVICIFSYFGYLLDKRLNTSPLLLLTGFFIGFVGMVYLFYKDSKK